MTQSRLMAAGPCLLALLIWAGPTAAQFERSIVLPPAEVDELDSASATHLENAKRFLTESSGPKPSKRFAACRKATPRDL